MQRLTFLSHFLLSLAVAAACFFAVLKGLPQAIYADAPWVVIAFFALVAFAVLYLGRQAWRTDSVGTLHTRVNEDLSETPIGWSYPDVDTHTGHLLERFAVMAGMFGTVIGLSMQLRAMHGSVDSLVAFSTQFASTGCGIVAAVIVAAMTHNIEAGIRRSAR